VEQVEKKPQKKRKAGLKNVRVALENISLDYFAKTYEELNNYKAASAHRTRDKLSGRFKGNCRMEK
jgi:hypothetical protein